jgi:enediyne biosynthesis protein E4
MAFLRLCPVFAVVVLTAGGVSAQPLRFSDVTAGSGLKVPKGCKPQALAVADFDGDGLPDVLIATFDEPHVRLFRNLGKLRFKDVTKGSGLEAFKGSGSGVAVGDFDRDGKLDVYLTSVRGGECRLFKGNGDLTFTDVGKESGTLLKAPARSCAWSDVDGDGWLDLFVTGPGGANKLFRNNKDGTFTDVSRRAGVELKGRDCLGCAFGDVDGDGRDDLFVTCYNSRPSALLKNLGGGKFKEVTGAGRLGRKASSVGCVFADVFNRGRLDLYVTTDSWLGGVNSTEKQLRAAGNAVEPNALYVNDGKGGFVTFPEPRLNFTGLSHDAVVEDLDNDGLVEIYAAVDARAGNKWATSKGGNPLWSREEGARWREVAWGVKAEANCICAVAADLDNDGDLDLLLVNFDSGVVLYRNNTNDGHSLRVKAVGKRSNLDGIGAQVWVYDTTGPGKRLVGHRHIQSGTGYCKCGPLEAHIGLGRKPAPTYQVEVFFPAAGKRVVATGIKPGRVVVVREGE